MTADAVRAQTPADEAAIRGRIAAHGEASGAGNARALSEVYADDARLVSANGAVTTGRQAIDDLWKRDVAAGAARGGRHHMHPADKVDIRFVSPEVAVVHVPSRNIGGTDSSGAALPSTEASLVTVWRKTGDLWSVVYQQGLPTRVSDGRPRPESHFGTWTLNVAKSTFDRIPPTTRQTVRYEPVGTDSMKLSIDILDERGPLHTETLGAFDGKDNSVAGSRTPNGTRSWTLIDDRTYVGTNKVDGRATGSEILIVSPDGKTMTIISTANKSVRVYEKQP